MVNLQEYLTIEQSFHQLLPKARIIEAEDIIEPPKKKERLKKNFGITVNFHSRVKKFQVNAWFRDENGLKVRKFVGYRPTKEEADRLADEYRSKTQ